MEGGDLASVSDVKEKQKSDEEEVVVDNRIPTQAEKDKKFKRGVAQWLIRARVPPRSFVRNMGPFLPFDVSQVEREVLKIHRERKDKAKKFLKDFEGKLTLSYDPVAYDDEWEAYDEEWDCSSKDGPVLHKGFVCVSVHFVDHNWKVRKWILGYSPIEFVREQKVQVYRFRNVILDYEIEEKVCTVLVPSYADLGHKPFGTLRKWIEKRGKNQIDPCFFRIYCCSDLFRLMAGHVSDDVDFLLEDIRVLVGWGKMSSTNWNVTLSSLQEALDMEDKKVFAEDAYYQEFDQPCDEDWMMIRTFCKLAGCIYKVAKELFEGGYSTSNVYFHLLAELKAMLNQELTSAADNDYLRCKAKEILERFDKYWDDMFLVLATASVLDPRFKMKYLEFYCSKNQVCDEASKAETVLDYLRNLYAHYAARDIRPQTECLDATVDSLSYTSEEDEKDDESDPLSYTSEEEEEDEDDKEEAEEGGKECGEDEEGGEEQKDKEEKKPDSYKDFVFFQEYLKFEESSREFDGSELDSYLKEPVVEWDKEFKALEWWRGESQKYPILSRVARDILSIPISRATSYNAYVADKRECPEFVVTMKAKLVNAMMCSKRWSRL